MRAMTWTLTRGLGAAVIIVGLVVHASAADQVPLDGVTPDHGLAWLFAPATAPPGAYDVFRSSRPIAKLADELRRRESAATRGRVAGPARRSGHRIRDEGRYDRARLARLFVGRQVEVARGALASGGDVSSYTLVTPVPDPTLSTLDHDTMVIVTHVGRLRRPAGDSGQTIFIRPANPSS